MRAERAKLSRHNAVAKALDYMLTRWPAFTRFLDDGRICLTNNAAERALRGLCHTTFNVKNVKPAISMTYCSARYLINDTLLDNIAHLPTSYLRIVS